MTTKRRKYQNGTIERVPRSTGPDVWIFRYRDSVGKNRKETLGTVKELPNRMAVEAKAEPIRVRVNGERHNAPTFGTLIERYKAEALPARHATASPYLSILKRIEEAWGSTRIEDMNVLAIEQWLASLQTLPQERKQGATGMQAPARPLAKKTLSNIKAVMHRVWQCGIRWGLLEPGNRMALIELKGIRRPRAKQRTVLSAEEFAMLTRDQRLPHAVRVMVHVAGRMGLRASECLGLRWDDIDFAAGTLHVQRSVVASREEDTKTPESEAVLPIPGALKGILAEWHKAQPDINGWVFGSPMTGKPLNRENLLRRYLAPTAAALGIVGMGWLSLRHTFRSVARDAALAPEDQRELMRHTDIRMTEHYGKDSAQRIRRLRAAGEKVSELFDKAGKKKAGRRVVEIKREEKKA